MAVFAEGSFCIRKHKREETKVSTRLTHKMEGRYEAMKTKTRRCGARTIIAEPSPIDEAKGFRKPEKTFGMGR